jgi:hypothetical protein
VLLTVDSSKKERVEVNAMEEGEINDEAGEEMEMEDMDYAKLKKSETKENGCGRNRN